MPTKQKLEPTNIVVLKSDENSGRREVWIFEIRELANRESKLEFHGAMRGNDVGNFVLLTFPEGAILDLEGFGEILGAMYHLKSEFGGLYVFDPSVALRQFLSDDLAPFLSVDGSGLFPHTEEEAISALCARFHLERSQGGS